MIGRLSGELSAGWFRSGSPRAGSRSLGAEIGGLVTFRVADGFGVDAGVAHAVMGESVGAAADDLHEAFVRAQFQF